MAHGFVVVVARLNAIGGVCHVAVPAGNGLLQVDHRVIQLKPRAPQRRRQRSTLRPAGQTRVGPVEYSPALEAGSAGNRVHSVDLAEVEAHVDPGNCAVLPRRRWLLLEHSRVVRVVRLCHWHCSLMDSV